jgi:hypothetical protein
MFELYLSLKDMAEDAYARGLQCITPVQGDLADYLKTYSTAQLLTILQDAYTFKVSSPDDHEKALCRVIHYMARDIIVARTGEVG